MSSYDADWQEKYAALIATADEAMARFEPGQRVFIGTGCAEPLELVRALTRHSSQLPDTEIVPVGDWILRRACRQNAIWNEQGHRGLRVSVNVSSQQFLEPGFADVVRTALEETGLPPVSLELEITESSLLRDVEVTVNTLSSLKELGVRLAIDDFGTGYSSLSYLKQFPIDRLKIDRSFVRDIVSDPNDAAITSAVIGIARSMGVRVIAEGVETPDQLEVLASKGCDEVQGFHLSRPMSATQILRWSAAGEDGPPAAMSAGAG